MKSYKVFGAVLSAAAFFCRCLLAAAPGGGATAAAQSRYPAITNGLAQNRPAPVVKPSPPTAPSQMMPSPPGQHGTAPSGAVRTPDAKSAPAGRQGLERQERERQPGHDGVSNGLGKSGFGDHHWGYGWREGHRPGEFQRLPPVPPHSQLFQHWDYLYDNSRFELSALPRELRVMLRPGQSVSFQVEEDMTSGYRWMANYDRRHCAVEIVHQINRRSVWSRSWTGATGVAEIEIQARMPGLLVIDLVYAKPQEWAHGVVPTIVAQVFLQVKPR